MVTERGYGGRTDGGFRSVCGQFGGELYQKIINKLTEEYCSERMTNEKM